MVLLSPFKKTVLVSALGHLVVFSLFSVSFGRAYPEAKSAAIAFWGQCLSPSQIVAPDPLDPSDASRSVPVSVRQERFIGALEKSLSTAVFSSVSGGQRKPEYSLNAVSSKHTYSQPPRYPQIEVRGDEPDVTLHPILPYALTLYFKDRDLAHVELEFKIVSAGMRDSVIIRRTISSGNLDADLVSMRYISHYLSMQQAQFSRDTWHTVRIDLSARDQQ